VYPAFFVAKLGSGRAPRAENLAQRRCVLGSENLPGNFHQQAAKSAVGHSCEIYGDCEGACGAHGMAASISKDLRAKTPEPNDDVCAWAGEFTNQV
jgi:hypothetical protein